jgi:hypothetical protein
MNSSHTDLPPGRGCPLILTWVGSVPSCDMISDGSNALPLIRQETRYECMSLVIVALLQFRLRSHNDDWRNIDISERRGKPA